VWAGLFPFPLSARAFKNGGLAMLHALYLGLPACMAVWLLMADLLRRFARGSDRTSKHGEISREHQKARQETGGNKTSDESKPSKACAPRQTVAVLGWILLTALLAASPLVVCHLSKSPKLNAVLQVDYYCYRKLWPQAIEAARGAADNIQVVCALNQALYHTGRLGEELSLSQDPATLLLYDQKYRPDWNVIDIYLDLGFVNMANHYLVEAMDIYGERPSLLRRLALVNVALGNTGTARIYFNALKRVPFHSAWAGGYLLKMDRDPSLPDDEVVAGMRRIMMKDNHIIPLPVDKLMLKLLEQNKRNRMAYEYFSAYCLLTKNIPAWIGQLKRLDDFNWGGLPRYYQEAAVLAVRGLGLTGEIKGGRIDSQTLQRFDDFAAKLKTFGTDRRKASEDMRKEYGDSYYYFYYLR
jgi:hypothetical protein